MVRVEVSEDAERDLDLTFAFLADSYASFGHPPAEAAERALRRTREVRDEVLSSLAKTLRIGTLHDDLLLGLRHVTIGRAVAYFRLSGDDAVMLLALFFGGQDHQTRMLSRLLS